MALKRRCAGKKCNGKFKSKRQRMLCRQFPHAGADFVRRLHGFDEDDVRSL
jgi:hypothetical protein